MNQAHAILDAIAHPVIQGIASAPPASPEEGEAWIVLGPATAAWAGHEDAIAAFMADQWVFVSPVTGMQAFNQETSRRIYFMDNWTEAPEPVAPSGGATVDAEARSAIEQVIAALRQIGVFSPI